MKTLLETLLLPPAGPLLLLAAGLILKRRRLAFAGLALAWLAATPLVGDNLLAARQTFPALAEPFPEAQAIVVLTAGRLRRAPEYGGTDVPDRVTLMRLRYAAWLHRRTGLPVLVTGGRVDPADRTPLGRLAARVLREDFGVSPVWEENEARNTWENTRFSAARLRARGIERVFLVTHAWHMPRAVYAFRQAGLDPIPAPTAFVHGAGDRLLDYLPRAYAVRHGYWALHEWLGLLWYRLQ